MIRVSPYARRLLGWTAAIVVSVSPVARAQPAAPAATAQAGAASQVTSANEPVDNVPTPEAFFGFRMGTDGRLAGAEAIERYFEAVSRRSLRVRLLDIGATTDGHRTIAALVTSPRHLANLDRIQEANRRLADPRRLTPEDAAALSRTQPAVLAIGASIHATEVGGSQALNELLHRLATADDDVVRATLESTVTILIPMLNPDGHRLVTEWYAAHAGTAIEGGPMPWLYHKYAGHDINRDAFMMNLAESRNLAAFFYRQWHPQVFLTIHEMGSNGPRFFVPPNTDPIDVNYDPLIWRTAGLLGGAMGFELQRDGRRGVLSNGMYDYYWPGYEDSAPLGHNTVCLLTEVASVRVATPITVPPEELRGGQKGLPDYRARINFPDPWPGGRWTLRDIVEYDLTAVTGLLKAVAAYREPIVRNFYDMGRRAIEAGERDGPFAFVIPPAQHDPFAAARLRDLLLQGEIEVQRATEGFTADGHGYPAGSDIIFLAQPFRSYVKTLLERQHYPMPPGRNGESERPYDVTGWTLPLQMGVEVRTIERRFTAPATTRVTSARVEPAVVTGERKPGHFVIEAPGTAGALAATRLMQAGLPVSWTLSPQDVRGFHYPAGALVVPATGPASATVTAIARDLGLRAEGVKGKVPAVDVVPIGRARIGVYAPWFDNISEGWTRWLLDQYGFPFVTLRAADIRAGQLRTRVDAIVIPSAPIDLLVTGNRPGLYPPDYVGGIGEPGMTALRRFVQEGGTLITLDQAGDLAIRTFDLPVRDTAAANEERFYCPGSLVQLQVDTTMPLGFGMPRETAAFFSSSAAYAPDARERAAEHGVAAANPPPLPGAIERVATYGDTSVLLSGYIEGEEVIARQGALITSRIGEGRVILFGFQPHHRGQSLATFRLLFNALLTAPPRDTGNRIPRGR